MKVETKRQMIEGLISTFKAPIGGYQTGFIECYKISKDRLNLLLEILKKEWRKEATNAEVEDKQEEAG